MYERRDTFCSAVSTGVHLSEVQYKLNRISYICIHVFVFILVLFKLLLSTWSNGTRTQWRHCQLSDQSWTWVKFMGPDPAQKSDSDPWPDPTLPDPIHCQHNPSTLFAAAKTKADLGQYSEKILRKIAIDRGSEKKVYANIVVKFYDFITSWVFIQYWPISKFSADTSNSKRAIIECWLKILPLLKCFATKYIKSGIN